jgi:hypothetical protein
MKQQPTIVTKTIVKEESSVSQSTTYILISLVAIMGVIIIGTAIFCVIKRRKVTKPVHVMSANQVQPEGIVKDFDDVCTVKVIDDEGDEKPQFDANNPQHLKVDYLAPSKKRVTTANSDGQNTSRALCSTPRTENQTPRQEMSASNSRSLHSTRRMVSQSSEDFNTFSNSGARPNSHATSAVRFNNDPMSSCYDSARSRFT